MKTNRAGIELIKVSEGCRLKAYRDQAGIPTIGWGTTTAAGFGEIKMGMTITQEQADEWLVASLPKYEAIVQRSLKRNPNENQFSAMVSLCYNIPKAFPESTVVRQFNAGNAQAAADAFLLWNKVRDPVTGKLEESNGLKKRREAERQLFLRPVVASPVPDEPAKEPARNWLTVLIEAIISIFRSRK
jgi:lysozyme